MKLNDDNGFTNRQLAKHIDAYETELPDIPHADIVLVGVNETRGSSFFDNTLHAAKCIRKQLHQLHYWPTDLIIADIGNIRQALL